MTINALDTFTSIVLPGDAKIREHRTDGVWEHVNTAPSPEIWVFTRTLRSVRPLRPADSSERTVLFDKLGLPQVTVLPVQKTSQWLVMPANLNAYTKSVKAKIPLPLTFAPETVSMFDPVLARVYKQRRTWLLYEDLNERFPTQQIERLRELFAYYVGHGWEKPPEKLSAEQLNVLELALKSWKRPIETMSEYALKLSGAKLLKVEDLGSGQYRVNYQYKGYFDSVIINDTLTVLNSGICLDGNDQNFDLSSIVFVKDKKRSGNISGYRAGSNEDDDDYD
jgi:hypothetical protein